MNEALRLSLLLVALLLGAPTSVRADALTTKRDAVRAKAAKERVKLARWCAKQKLHAAAKRHYQVAAELGDAGAKAALEGAFPPDAPKNAKAAARGLRKRRAKLNKKLVSLWGGFATWAEKKKHAEAALAAWRRVLAADPGHAVAGRQVAAAAVRAIELDDAELSAEQKRHPQTQRARRIFTRNLPSGLATVQRKLGISVAPGQVKVQLLWGGGKMAAVTRTGTPPARIRVYCDRWTAKKADPDLVTLVTHELVHALCAANMGHDKYKLLPKWFNEGLALHVAEQGPGRLRWALDNNGQQVDPFLNGLEAGKQKNPEDYAEGYLAIRYLLDALGPKGFDALMRAIIRDTTPFAKAIEDATGKAPAAFERAAHAWARKRFKAIAAEK